MAYDSTMVRTPLQSRTSLGALDCVPNLGVPPALSFIFLAILCGILLILAFAFATILRVVLAKFLLEICDLSGEGNDLGVCSTRLLPTPFCNHVAIKDIEIVNDCVLIGLLACDPGILCRTNVQCKSFIDSSFGGTK